MPKLELDIANLPSEPTPYQKTKIKEDVKKADGIVIATFNKTEKSISVWACGWIHIPSLIKKLLEIKLLESKS